QPLLKRIEQLHAAQAVQSQVLRQAEIVRVASLLIARHTFPGEVSDEGQQPILIRGRGSPSRFASPAGQPRNDNSSFHLTGRGARKIRLRPKVPTANA